MITLIRMKYKEWKLKLALYTVLEAVSIPYTSSESV